jgi:hypothetical protein
MYLSITKAVPQGLTITSQHYNNNNIKDIVTINRPNTLQILFFTLLSY